MDLLQKTLAAIGPLDQKAQAQAQGEIDNKTKPRGSLGRLEALAVQLAAITGQAAPPAGEKVVVVMAGDHGVAEEGVSAFPQEVTGQMVLNFAQGGAAINVLARQAGARVVVADLGVKGPYPRPESVENLSQGPGTANLAQGPAMSLAQTVGALEAGIGLAQRLVGQGAAVLAVGEMGIANTTPSAALAAAWLGLPPEQLCGRGTGVDDAGLARKVEAVKRGLAANQAALNDPLETLAALGGFEIAGLAGLMLGAAAARKPVVLDGFITTAAALAAVRLAPQARHYLIPSHCSVELGHRAMLKALGLEPLFDLSLRLGEGSGAALALMWVEAARAILLEMATFSSAGVSQEGA